MLPTLNKYSNIRFFNLPIDIIVVTGKLGKSWAEPQRIGSGPPSV
jgi:hypothetical protein